MTFYIPPDRDILRRAVAAQPQPSTAAQTGLTGLAHQLVSDFDRRRFGAIEDQVVAAGEQMTPEDVARVMGDADARAGRSFASARGTLARQEAGLGGTLDATEQASQDRRLKLAEAAARVDARNRALGAERDRRQAARSAAFGLEGGITGLALRGLGTAAGMETQREADYRRALAEYKAKKAGAIGNLAGIAASFIPVVGAFVAPAVKQAATKAAM